MRKRQQHLSLKNKTKNVSEKKDATPINIPPYIEITCKMKDAKNKDIMKTYF